MSEKDVRELKVVVEEIKGRVCDLENRFLDNVKHAQEVKVAFPMNLPPAVPETFVGTAAPGAKKKIKHD
jgi:hypothetical protein